jgi:hypothetical protein
VLGLEDLVPRTECKNLIITSVCDYVTMRWYFGYIGLKSYILNFFLLFIFFLDLDAK